MAAERFDYDSDRPISPARGYANANTHPAARADFEADQPFGAHPVGDADAEPGNIVPFKQQQQQSRGALAETGAAAEERSDMRLPAFMTRGQTALAPDAEPAVTVTATERKFSFELPLDDPRISRGLYGVGSVLARAGVSTEANLPAAQAEPAADAAETAKDVVTVVSHSGGPERHAALALPMPIREHEHRG